MANVTVKLPRTTLELVNRPRKRIVRELRTRRELVFRFCTKLNAPRLTTTRGAGKGLRLAERARHPLDPVSRYPNRSPVIRLPPRATWNTIDVRCEVPPR